MPQRTVLLAEPDARLRTEWRAGLEGLGLHVREASDGGSALRAIQHSQVSLLVAELYLPTGTESCLVRAARHEPALQSVKILVVTNSMLDADREWALSAGADAYLVKPVLVSRMLQVAAQLAASRRPSRGQVLSGQTARRTTPLRVS
jgi:CheY-like chemotaxis protein